jgi:hypothetical protein
LLLHAIKHVLDELLVFGGLRTLTRERNLAVAISGKMPQQIRHGFAGIAARLGKNECGTSLLYPRQSRLPWIGAGLSSGMAEDLEWRMI